jgi:hypothetical protein
VSRQQWVHAYRLARSLRTLRERFTPRLPQRESGNAYLLEEEYSLPPHAFRAANQARALDTLWCSRRWLGTLPYSRVTHEVLR